MCKFKKNTVDQYTFVLEYPENKFYFPTSFFPSSHYINTHKKKNTRKFEFLLLICSLVLKQKKFLILHLSAKC